MLSAKLHNIFNECREHAAGMLHDSASFIIGLLQIVKVSKPIDCSGMLSRLLTQHSDRLSQ
jgi:hypothetical protein